MKRLRFTLLLQAIAHHECKKIDRKLARFRYFVYLCRRMATLKKTQTGTMKAQLADILMAVSWSDLSRTYFGKSNSWLYHKLDGIDGNKKPTDFTIEERYQLKGALIDLADRIRRAADTID